MSKNSLELKDFVNDPTFIENMNRAFSDLRADYELSIILIMEPIYSIKSIWMTASFSKHHLQIRCYV